MLEGLGPPGQCSFLSWPTLLLQVALTLLCINKQIDTVATLPCVLLPIASLISALLNVLLLPACLGKLFY
jgi:hypothetical protein